MDRFDAMALLQVVGIIGHDHMGERALGRQPTFDQPIRHIRLNYPCIAAAAGITRANRDDDLEAGRDNVQPFGTDFAYLHHVGAAAGADCLCGLDHLFDARQMVWLMASEKRSNATHVSTTDPQARLYKKSPGTGAVLCFMGHALTENRHGLVVQGDLTQADGHAERKAALEMRVHRHSPGSTRRLTLGADKGYDTADFVADLREACVTPQVAQKSRHSAIDGRTTRHEG